MIALLCKQQICVCVCVCVCVFVFFILICIPLHIAYVFRYIDVTLIIMYML